MKDTGALKITTPTDREIVITRGFDAPRRLVFDALTKPELLRRWFSGPPGWSLVICEIDLKVGGALRFVFRGPDGTDMGMSGVYREIVPNERIVNTDTKDGCDTQAAGEALVTTVLVEHAGKTRLTSTLLFPSRELRDAVINSGMERGVTANYDRLDEYLASIA
ncbi:MAG TPA: SRPBCC family protein [Isosphaeraceae bacterium]|jgi:uncharacterized protein YndB with AHSA1/START domain|nr:SRPBCC family protein [Isosphaeraceae bacterium]